MVFFSCDGCGEMLKKNKVDAHAARCRRCVSVSCVDCSVSFWGDDYRTHTSCITEAERYEIPRDAKRNNNKKRNPQQEWMDVVGTCAAAAPAHLREAMTAMATLDNIPRKPKPFANFASNSLRPWGSDKRIVDEIWGHLQEERLKRIARKESEKKQADEATNNRRKEDEEAAREKQQQREDDDGKSTDVEAPVGEPRVSSSALSDESIDAKRVKKIAKKALKKAPNRSMKLKALRKILNREMGLPKSARKRLKSALLESARGSRDKLRIDGKVMILRE